MASARLASTLLRGVAHALTPGSVSSALGFRQWSSAAAAPFALDISAAMQRAVTPEVSQHLEQRGYAVVDGVFGSAAASAFREEILALHRDGLMIKNNTFLAPEFVLSYVRLQVKDGSQQLLEKQHIWEAELTLDPRVAVSAPLCARVNEDHTLPTMLSLFVPHLALDSQAIKLQYNAGQGGCFPIHVDSDEALDGRRVTAIFYVNPAWREGDGGEMRLYPWPWPGGPVDVAPRHDRLLLFSSCRMAHRVLPSTAPGRCCFTIWMSQSRRRRAASGPPQPPPGDPEADPQATLHFLLGPHMRTHVCKHVYADEWARSLEESHPPSPARDAALAQHWHEVGIIRRALRSYLPLIESLTHGQAPPEMLRAALAACTWFA